MVTMLEDKHAKDVKVFVSNELKRLSDQAFASVLRDALFGNDIDWNAVGKSVSHWMPEVSFTSRVSEGVHYQGDYISDEGEYYHGFIIRSYCDDTPGMPGYCDLTISKNGKEYRLPRNGYAQTIGGAKLFIDDVIDGILNLDDFRVRTPR